MKKSYVGKKGLKLFALVAMIVMSLFASPLANLGNAINNNADNNSRLGRVLAATGATLPVDIGADDTLGYDYENVAGLSNPAVIYNDDHYSANWRDGFAAGYTSANATTNVLKLAYLADLSLEQGNFFRTGTGLNENNAYVISTPLQLAFLGELLSIVGNSNSNPTGFAIFGSYYKLGANIDLGQAYSTSPNVYAKWTPLVNFSYTRVANMYFDGNNYSINNAYVKEDAAITWASIFGCWPAGSITNLTVNNAHIVTTVQTRDARAGVVKISNSTSNPTEFNNITINNCKVEACGFAVGITDNALLINNSKVVDSEIIVHTVRENQIATFTTYAFGFGISKKVIADNASLINEYGLFNSKVTTNTIYKNYTAATVNSTATNYVGGIAYNAAAGQCEYSNLKVKDSEITLNIDINNSANNAWSEYSLQTNNYVGGVVFSSAGADTCVVKNVDVSNSLIKSTYNYGVDSELIAGEMYPNFVNRVANYMYGVGYTTSTFNSNVSNYENVNIVNSDVLIDNNIFMRRASGNSASYYSIIFSNYMNGIAYNNSSAITYRLDKCNVTNCNLLVDSNVETMEEINSNYLISSTNRVAGIVSGTHATIRGCIVNNCMLNIDSDSVNRLSSLPNSIVEDAKVYGLGIGSFLPFVDGNGVINCEVNSCTLIANATPMKYYTDISGTNNTISLNSVVLGAGETYNSSSFENNVKGVIITGCVFNNNADVNTYSSTPTNDAIVSSTAITAGLAYNGGANTRAFNHTDCLVENVKFDTFAESNTTVSAMSINSSSLYSGSGYNYKNCNVNNVVLNTENGYGAMLISGMSVNNSTANGGNTFGDYKLVEGVYQTDANGDYIVDNDLDCSVTNVTINAIGASSTSYITGMSYNIGACTGGANNHIGSDISNILVDFESNDNTENRNMFVVGMGYNISANQGNNYDGCTVSNLQFDVTKNGDNSTNTGIIVSGMGYNTSALYGGNSYKNCSVSQVAIEGNVTAGSTGLVNVTGMGYNGGAITGNDGTNNYDNCSVDDLDIVITGVTLSSYIAAMGRNNATSNLFCFTDCEVSSLNIDVTSAVCTGSPTIIGAGMGFNTSSEKHTYDYCSVNTATINIDQNSTTGEAHAYGLAYNTGANAKGNTYNAVTVENVDVTAKSIGGAAYAIGMVYNSGAYIGGIKFKDCYIKDTDPLKDYQISATSNTSSAIALGFNYTSYNSYNSNGMSYDNCDITNYKLTSESINGTATTTGIAYTNNSYVSTNTGDYEALIDLVEFVNCDVVNVINSAESNTGAAYAVGVNYKAGHNVDGVRYYGCNVTYGSLDASSNGEAYASGLAVNKNTVRNGYYFWNCNVSDLNMNSISVNSNAFTTGMVNNIGTIADGFGLYDCHVTNVNGFAGGSTKANIENPEFNWEILYNSAYAIGMAYNKGTVSSSGTMTNLVTSRNSEGDITGQLPDLAVSGFDFIDCSVGSTTNSKVEFKAYATNTTGAFASGMAYNASSVNSDHSVMNNNKVYNADILVKTKQGSTLQRPTIFAAGMSINVSNAIIDFTNCISENNIITSTSTVANNYAAGMGYNSTKSHLSSYTDCVAQNNVVSAYYSGEEGGTTLQTSAAWGLAGYYSSLIDRCIVGSGSVTATNKVGNAFATGVSQSFGVSITGSDRINSDLTATNMTKITNSYNYSEVFAETLSITSYAYASGIGQAEYIDSCYNAGNVTGNYAGGISVGYLYEPSNNYNLSTQTDATKFAFSRPLTLTNNVNTGNICKANNGGVSYIGGILGVYRVQIIKYRKLVLENNINLGGIYSKYNLIDNEVVPFEQNVTSSIYLGNIYGFISYNYYGVTATDVTGLTDVYTSQRNALSIKNNYYNSEINNALNIAVTDGTTEVVDYLDDEPYTNYVKSCDGVVYVTAISGTTNNQLFEDLYESAMNIGASSYAKNVAINNNYSQADFNIASASDLETYINTINSDENAYNNFGAWTLNANNTPQQSNIDFKYQIIEFNANGLSGTIPNIILIDKTQSEYSFIVPLASLNQTGYSVNSWSVNSDGSGLSVVANTTCNQDILAYVANYPVITLWANVSYTNYLVTFTANPNGTPTLVGGITIPSDSEHLLGYISLENPSAHSLSTTYDESSSLNAVEWYVGVDGVTNGYELMTITTGANITHTLPLNNILNVDFVDKWANQDNEINFFVKYITLATYTITFNDIDTDAYTLTKSTPNNIIVAGGNVSFAVSPYNHYEFIRYEITIGGVAQPNVTDLSHNINDVNEDIVVNILVQKIQYQVAVSLQNQAGFNLDSEYYTHLLSGVLPTVSINDNVPQLSAITDYTFNENNSAFRFVGWKLANTNTYLPVELSGNLATISEGVIIDSSSLSNYVSTIGGVNMFNMVAVFQLQYKFSLSLINPSMSLLSEYLITYSDSDNQEVAINSTISGSYNSSYTNMIDSGTSVTVTLYPNSRADIDSVNFDPVSSGTRIGNIIIVTMMNSRSIVVEFVEKVNYSVVIDLYTMKNERIDNSYKDLLLLNYDENNLPIIAPETDVDITVPTVTAIQSFYGSNGVGYVFAGWRLTSSGNFISTNLELSGYTMSNSAFTNYANSADYTFDLLAIYVRQFRLDFALNNPDSLESNFVMQYEDSNGEYSYSSLTDGAYVPHWINDEGVSVRVTLLPNDRVNIDENNSILDGAQLANTILFVFMTQPKDIEVAFVIKSDYQVSIRIIDQRNETIAQTLFDDLIVNYNNIPKISPAVGYITIPQVEAQTFVAFDDDKIAYRFLGWKLKDDMTTYLSVVDGSNGLLANNIQMDQNRFYGYVDAENEEFEIIAVFQRQLLLQVELDKVIKDNDEADVTYRSGYKITYTDANNVDQTFENNKNPYQYSGSYWIDENTFVEIEIKANKRVNVVAPEGIKFGANVAYLSMTQDLLNRDLLDLLFTFVVKYLNVESSVMMLNHPEQENSETFSRTLLSAIEYDIERNLETLPEDLKDGQLMINDVMTIGYNTTVLNNSNTRFIQITLLNVVDGKYYTLTNNSANISGSFYDNYVSEDGVVTICLKVIQQWIVEVIGENLTDADYTLGEYSFDIIDPTVTSGNNSVLNTNRVVQLENTSVKKRYLVDTGLIIKVLPTAEKYCQFSGFSGLFEGEMTNNNADILANSDRAVSLRFDKVIYSLVVNYDASVGGELSFTKSFVLGDTISISYTPKSNYQIIDWTIGNKTLAQLGATQSGNTVTLIATDELLDAIANQTILNDEKILHLTSDIKTMMSKTLFYGLVGGGATIALLFIVVLLLIIRQQKLKKQKAEKERQLNDIARKFNVADFIKDLKSSSPKTDDKK